MYHVDGVRRRKDFTGIKLCEDDLIDLAERYVGLLPIGVLAGLRRALAAQLARDHHSVYAHDLHLEQFLNRALDLKLVRARIGDEGVLVQLFALARAFFGQARGLNYIKSIHWFNPL